MLCWEQESCFSPLPQPIMFACSEVPSPHSLRLLQHGLKRLPSTIAKFPTSWCISRDNSGALVWIEARSEKNLLYGICNLSDLISMFVV